MAITPSELDEIGKWLDAEAAHRGLAQGFHRTFAREDNEWLYWAVNTGSGTASERAVTLREIEDAWDNQHPNTNTKLLLIPSAT